MTYHRPYVITPEWQARTTIDPRPLEAILRVLLDRAIFLVAHAISALGSKTAPGIRLYTRLAKLGFLVVTLLRRLPELAAAAFAPPKPRKPSKDRGDRLEGDEHLDGLDRPIVIGKSVPAIVAQICRELAAISKSLGQDARDELAALAAQAKAAAAEWPRPEAPTPTPITQIEAPRTTFPESHHPAPAEPPPRRLRPTSRLRLTTAASRAHPHAASPRVPARYPMASPRQQQVTTRLQDTSPRSRQGHGSPRHQATPRPAPHPPGRRRPRRRRRSRRHRLAPNPTRRHPGRALPRPHPAPSPPHPTRPRPPRKRPPPNPPPHQPPSPPPRPLPPSPSPHPHPARPQLRHRKGQPPRQRRHRRPRRTRRRDHRLRRHPPRRPYPRRPPRRIRRPPRHPPAGRRPRTHPRRPHHRRPRTPQRRRRPRRRPPQPPTPPPGTTPNTPAATTPAPTPAEPAPGPVAVLVPSAGPPRILQEQRRVTPISLDVVDYTEAGSIRFTGAAAPNAALRLYVDNAAAGDIRADAAGRWTLAPETPVPPGIHTLRVDELDQAGRVLTRIELPFQRAAPAATEATGRVVVQPGQSLWRLARNAYGSGMRYTAIYLANREQIRNPGLIYPGQTFTVPTQPQ